MMDSLTNGTISYLKGSANFYAWKMALAFLTLLIRTFVNPSQGERGSCVETEVIFFYSHLSHTLPNLCGKHPSLSKIVWFLIF
jgi:hypothetical protein